MYAPAIDDLVISRAEPATEAGGDFTLELEILEFDIWELLRIEGTYGCAPGSTADGEEEPEFDERTAEREAVR